ncbi:hypothetical protein SAMN05444161_8454 [Rhizobiales bacterium GAS191]|nr:hypothetical protein SAMN05444161_8454 [Rhizobiales bacterium GAS191]
MKLLRTIRVDASDTFVFRKAAEPGEWAVSGAFAFARVDPEALERKARTAFCAGFLGIGSLGWSTLVQIVEACEEDRLKAIDMLAAQFVAHFGAPDVATARLAAEEEIAFAASLCDHPTGTLAAVSRRCVNGSIHEIFRALSPGTGAMPTRPFDFLEVVGDDETPAEHIDLAKLAKGDRS